MLTTGNLITYKAVPFLYLPSVCKYPQCLISALTQAGGGGLLFRFAGSVVLQGGRGTADKILLRVGSTRSVPATLGLPLTGVSVLSPSTLLRLQAALWGVGPE